MPSNTAIRADLRFGRVLLIYALERTPLGWIPLTKVLPLAGDPANPHAQRRLQAAPQHLTRHGLVDVDISDEGVARYRRTMRGRALAQRLIRDRRVSFTKAVGAKVPG